MKRPLLRAIGYEADALGRGGAAGAARRRGRPRRRRVRGVPARDPLRLHDHGARAGHVPRVRAAGRGRHVEPHPRRARRAQATLPVPLDRASRLRPRARDPARPRARGARRTRASGGGRGRGAPRARALQATGCRRDDRLGERARPRSGAPTSTSTRSTSRSARSSSTARTRSAPRAHGVARAGRRRRWSGVPELDGRGRRLRPTPAGRRPRRAGRHHDHVRGGAGRGRGGRRATHVYWAGRTTLVRRPEDVAVYDRAFAAWWDGASRSICAATDRARAHARVRPRRRRATTTAPSGDDGTETADACRCATAAPRCCASATSRTTRPAEFAEARKLMSRPAPGRRAPAVAPNAAEHAPSRSP